MCDTEFLNIFNEQYPFERYIVKEPKPITGLFDDALLTEIFVPSTEIKPLLDDNGRLITFTRINDDEIYVKVKGPAGEMRFAYYDFNDHVREEIQNIVITDFGDYEWECLYVDMEDMSDLQEALESQKELIVQKYGECKIKENFTYTQELK